MTEEKASDNEKKTVRVTTEEAVRAQAFVQEAIVNLLEKKGLLSKEELLKEIERIKFTLEHPNRN